MSYATRADLVARHGAADADVLAPAPAGPGGPDRAEAHLADASAVVDQRLAAVFALPLPPGDWPVLKSIVCRLAWLTLHDGEAPEAAKAAAARARRDLDRLARGVLTAADGTPAPRLPQARATAPAPAFGREALRDA